MQRLMFCRLTLAAIAVLFLATFTLTGCGKDESGAKKTTNSNGAPSAGGGGESGPATGGEGKPGDATISGKVTFKGTPPSNDRIDMTGTPDCAKQHPDGARAQFYCVGKDGGLQWVLLSITKGDGVIDKKWEVTSTPVMLDQKGCTYEPHVIGVMVGQTIQIRNSDPLMHNIHFQPMKNDEANTAQQAGQAPLSQVFKKPEAWFPIKCDVHNWMHAFAGVFSHPYFAVSDASGAYTIAKLPAGKYTVHAQHEKLGGQDKEIEVKAGATAKLDFEFEKK